MSHFTCLVIGENPKEQLAPFSEKIEVAVGTVSEEDLQSFLNYYKEKGYVGTFEALYSVHGSDWNSRRWKKDANGVLTEYSTYNPLSKWDWYVLGGRWSGMIKLKEGATGTEGKPGAFNEDTGIDQAKKGDVANLDEIHTFAVLKDGVWYEKGKMLWWAVVKDAKEEAAWSDEFASLLTDVSDDTLISIYDLHI